MTFHKQKRPTIAGSGTSKSIHLQQANNPYFNMILDNEECVLFCCEILQHFDDLVNKHWIGDPVIDKAQRLNLYLALAKLNDREAI
jgi:hypothetical protein